MKKGQRMKKSRQSLFPFYCEHIVSGFYYIYKALWRIIKVKRVFANNNKRAILAVNKKLRSAFERSLSFKE